MKPNIKDPLIKIDSNYPHEIVDIDKLIQKYGEDKVKEAIDYLNYKHVDVLPKIEEEGFPILYVFRHGQTIDNANMIFSGWRDVEITDTGKIQAEKLIDKLAQKKIHLLISSDMIRAIETMKIAISRNDYAKTLTISTDQRIRERSYGDWQGRSKLVKQLEDPEGLHAIRRGYDVAPPNGESLKDTVERVKNFTDEIVPLMKKDKINVAISCHGNSIRGFRSYFENLSTDELSQVETPLGTDYLAYTIK